MEEIAKKCGLDPKVVVEATDILYDSGYICGKTAEKEFWSALKSGLAWPIIPMKS